MIPITVGNTTGQAIISYDLNVDFNPAIIQPANPAYDAAGTLSNAMSITPNAGNAGHFVISAFQGVPLDGSGTLINLRFNVIGSLGQSTALTFADYTDPANTFHPGFMFNEGVPEASVTNGSVAVGTGTPTNTATSTPTPSGPTVTGAVAYGNAIGPPTTRFVPGVTVRSIAGSPSVTSLTNSNGDFVLTGFGAGAYTLAPSKEDDTSGALSAFDSALIAQHVIGILPRLSGNALVVADVSANGFVNSYDAGLIASFVNASPYPHGFASKWRFLPASKTYGAITGFLPGQNFTALLMGDVSGNWGVPGAVPVGQVRKIEDGGQDVERSTPGSVVSVELPALFAPIGREIVLPVTVQGAANKDLIAYEFSLRYDPSVIQPSAEPVDVMGTASRSLSVVTNAQEPGLLRVVLYGAFPIDRDGLLLNLRFLAVGKAGSVSPLKWERLKFNEGRPKAIVKDGKVTLR